MKWLGHFIRNYLASCPGHGRGSGPGAGFPSSSAVPADPVSVMRMVASSSMDPALGAMIVTSGSADSADAAARGTMTVASSSSAAAVGVDVTIVSSGKESLEY